MVNKMFTKDHEWICVNSSIGTVGITNFAQEQLGDVVFIELPEIGTKFGKAEPVAVVESVKVASEIFTPVSGEILEANDDLVEKPDLVNVAAETDGWFFKIKINDLMELEGLMSEKAYKNFVTKSTED